MGSENRINHSASQLLSDCAESQIQAGSQTQLSFPTTLDSRITDTFFLSSGSEGTLMFHRIFSALSASENKTESIHLELQH